MKLELRRNGTLETPDTQSIGISHLGCPDCNTHEHYEKTGRQIRLEEQKSGLFWCHVCGTLWESCDADDPVTMTQSIANVSARKASDEKYEASLDAIHAECKHSESEYCEVGEHYYDRTYGDFIQGVRTCERCGEEWRMERKEKDTGEYHGSQAGLAKSRARAA